MILVKRRPKKKISYERLFQILDEQSVMVKIEQDIDLVFDPPLELIDANRLRTTLEKERGRL